MPLLNVLSLTTGDVLVFGEIETANGNSSFATNVAKQRDDEPRREDRERVRDSILLKISRRIFAIVWLTVAPSIRV